MSAADRITRPGVHVGRPAKAEPNPFRVGTGWVRVHNRRRATIVPQTMQDPRRSTADINLYPATVYDPMMAVTAATAPPGPSGGVSDWQSSGPDASGRKGSQTAGLCRAAAHD